MSMRLDRLYAGLGVLALCAGLGSIGCTDDGDAVEVPDRTSYREWVKVELPGTVCGDGSQYKFFVNYSDVSNDLVIGLEPGGACWDYESCTGQSGIRGAANVNGLDDFHWETAPFINPFLQRLYDDNETKDWNMVYLPYCTGDVYAGNNVITYSDPNGVKPDIEFHHQGHNNMMAAIGWMNEQFTHVPKMLVNGCSAGGAGSIVNYYFIRTGMPGIERGFMLNDSGPIMPSTGWSKPLHDKVFDAWAVDTILADLPLEFDPNDFGTINTMLADQFPDDRLATTYFRRDFNFSLYSYERFYEYPPKDEIMGMWWDDTQLLLDVYDTRDNLAYYIPYWRMLNDSHCTTLISFTGSEIEEQNVGLEDFVKDLLNPDKPLKSYLESEQAGEDT